jgi:hypothetical protein
MSKISKAQREQLTGVAIGTVVLMGALWYFGVQAKQTELTQTRDKTAQMEKKLRDAEALIRQGDEIGDTLHDRSDILQKREAGLAPDRDTYAWLINTMKPFIQSRHGVSIYSYSPPEISDSGLIPGFPYRWATFHLRGTGYYQDFGKFFADFENSFPYFRIQNLDVSANTGPASEAEKLSFNFDVVAPVVTSDTK